MLLERFVCLLSDLYSCLSGVRKVRLCVRQRQGDAWEGEDDGELHLQLPQLSAGGERMDATTPPADRDV